MHHWERAAFDEYVAHHPEGSKARGRVLDVRPFGAFCELAAGVQGLLEVIHFEGASRPMIFPDDYPQVGDVLEVTIDYINRDAGKIRLTQRERGVF